MKTLLLVLFIIQMSAVNGKDLKAIYGEDDRFEAKDHPNTSLIQFSKSVAAMVHANKLLDSNQLEIVDFKKVTLTEILGGLCPGESYAEQYSLATCSGFLISPDTILTAGHCIVNEKDCVRYKWIFDFDSESEYFPKENVYGCKKILKQSLTDNRLTMKDYALVKLDRKVEKRSPLRFNRTQTFKSSSELAVIGHPMGLPLKIAGNGKKQKWSEYELGNLLYSYNKKYWYFRASLDSFAGNSGSPVINTETNLVEGILVSGAPDYTLTYEFGEPCKKAVVYPEHEREAEETVFKFAQLLYIQDNF